MQKENNIHEKHRDRMRKKADKASLLSMPEHEVLELMLMYAIPRVDTNPIAHRLIQSFGSLAKVMNADVKDLMAIKGIGEKSARYIKYLSQFVDCVKISKLNSVNYILKSTLDCIEFFRVNFEIENLEKVYFVSLNSKYKVLKVNIFDGDTATRAITDAREIAGIISSKDVSGVVVFHTHPGGKVDPSEEDMIATKRLCEICEAIGIKIVDHIIFNETTHYSFKTNNQYIQD